MVQYSIWREKERKLKESVLMARRDDDDKRAIVNIYILVAE